MNNCSICLDVMETDVLVLECNHIFHKNCLKKWICPICRTSINVCKVFNINHAICNGDEQTHFGFGYAPIVKWIM